MRKAGFFLVALVFVCGFAWSETVLIYIKKDDGNQFSEKALPLAYALEGGVMDEYFDAGHIIFNAGIKNISYWKEFPVNMARREGAGLLLEIVLRVKDGLTTEESSVAAAAYRLVLLHGMKVLAMGEIEAGSIPTDSKETEKISFLLGKELARKSLSSL